MKILHVTQTTGGVETSLLLLLRHLDRSRFALHLACPPETGLFQQAASLGVRVFPVVMVRHIDPRCDIAALVALWRLMRRERYDIVHAHSAKGGYLGRLAARLSRTSRTIYAPRAFSYLSQRGAARRFFLELERLARPLTTHVVAASESERRRAIEEVGFPPGRVDMIPNAVDTDALRRVGGSPTQLVPEIIMVGRLGYQKNPAMFVRVARLVLDRMPDARFTLIGGGFASPDEPAVREQIRDLGLRDRVMIVPWGEPLQILRRVAGAAVFVLTSRYEGMPNTVLEAMALARPVVATDVDGTRDVVRQGETGFLVPVDDDRAMAQEIVRLIETPDLAQALGERGAREAATTYDIRRTVQDLESLYERLMDGSRSRS